MRMMLLAAAGSIAMLTASASLAQVQSFGGSAFRGGHDGGGRDGRGHDHRGDRGPRGELVLGYYNYGDWGRYNNRTFEPDSFNDWWHDRPDRAYPRWMLKNSQTCERQWSSGAGWTC